jgi:hypothetical protein
MKEIIMHPVTNSSQISFIGYDTETETLRVTFARGQSYSYHPVSKSIYDQLIGSESIGSAFAKLIKANSSITFKKV